VFQNDDRTDQISHFTMQISGAVALQLHYMTTVTNYNCNWPLSVVHVTMNMLKIRLSPLIVVKHPKHQQFWNLVQLTSV